MLDSDLALLYDVTTGNFNKPVNRNAAPFPKELSFVLHREELANLMFQIGTSSGHGGRQLPLTLRRTPLSPPVWPSKWQSPKPRKRKLLHSVNC